jgi:hypothetical protein
MKNSVKKLVLTKKGEVSKAITNMIGNCSFDEKQRKIYVGYYSGSGKYTSAHSAESTVTDLLKAGEYKYTTGNDAPKGGVIGDFVKVSKTAFEFIYNFYPYKTNKPL